jgi:type VII secretion effector (TIGR04197 family)
MATGQIKSNVEIAAQFTTKLGDAATSSTLNGIPTAIQQGGMIVNDRHPRVDKNSEKLHSALMALFAADADLVVKAANQFRDLDNQLSKTIRDHLDGWGGKMPCPLPRDLTLQRPVVDLTRNPDRSYVDGNEQVLDTLYVVNQNGETVAVPVYADKRLFNNDVNAAKVVLGPPNNYRNCADLVQRYYEAKYGVTVSGLFGDGSAATAPNVNRGSMTNVSRPAIGDIAEYNNHWAIVVGYEGDNVILAEQNNSHVQYGSTIPVNRRVPLSNGVYWHYNP